MREWVETGDYVLISTFMQRDRQAAWRALEIEQIVANRVVYTTPGSWIWLSNRITSTSPWTCACPGGLRGDAASHRLPLRGNKMWTRGWYWREACI